jgi:hypothetical protein
MLLDLAELRDGAHSPTSLRRTRNKEKLGPRQKSHESAFLAAKKHV